MPTHLAERSPLSSLAACYAQWNDDSLTRLQKQKFEKDVTGKQVLWKVQVASVSEADNETIYVYVTEPTEGWDHPRACAVFPESEQNSLLSLKNGDWIILRGVIKDFFLWPKVEQCQIEKAQGAKQAAGHVR